MFAKMKLPCSVCRPCYMSLIEAGKGVGKVLIGLLIVSIS